MIVLFNYRKGKQTVQSHINRADIAHAFFRDGLAIIDAE